MIKPVFIPIQDGCLSINVAHILGVKPIDMGHYKGPRDIVELTLILTNGEEHKLNYIPGAFVMPHIYGIDPQDMSHINT